jgi:hypothetical protein
MNRKVTCILPNVNNVAKKRLDTFLQDVRDSDSTQPELENQKERSTNLIPSLRLPAENELHVNHIPLLDFENGRTLTILPGLLLYNLKFLPISCPDL